MKRQQKESDKPVISPASPLSFTDDVILSMIPKDELLKLATRINTYLEKEHTVSKEELYGRQETVPLSIFSQKLSPLEALVKFLKENKELAYHKIGTTIGRDERGVWVTYRNAKRKMEGQFTIPEQDILIPLTIFTKDLSILEALVTYLRDKKEMRGSKIASLINKSTSTIWTVYNRAKAKDKNR